MTAPEIDGHVRRFIKSDQWPNDRTTRALTLRQSKREPGCGLLYDRLARLRRDGKVFCLQVSATRTSLWWAQ